MTNTLITIQGRVVLVVQNALPHDDEDWGAILALARRPDLSQLRVLVCSEGATISSAQRRDLVDAMEDRLPIVAVMSGSRISRGITTAISWFKPGVKAFAPDDFDRAFAHLGLAASERAGLPKAIARDKARLHPPSARANLA